MFHFGKPDCGFWDFNDNLLSIFFQLGPKGPFFKNFGISVYLIKGKVFIKKSISEFFLDEIKYGSDLQWGGGGSIHVHK